MEVSASTYPDHSFTSEYLQMYENENENVHEVPIRSPRRPKMMAGIFSVNSETTNNVQIPSNPGNYSSEYTTTTSSGRGSIGSSLFSIDSLEHELESEIDVDTLIDEITGEGEGEICCVDSVVTIIKSHDQWDPKKVAIVATR